MIANRVLYQQVQEEGFAIVDDVLSAQEVDALLSTIETANTSKTTFRKTADLFAIRQFLKEIPQAFQHIFNAKLKNLVAETFGRDYFVVKSIYFDKPESSNWFVAYHQDLTISVNQKADVVGFEPWTVKQNQFAVQPPLKILQDNLTLRIHLDDTTAENGALRVVPTSHRNGIVRSETINHQKETEVVCEVKRGGLMVMKPLLLHASSRTTNNARRRVVHIELSRTDLPSPLTWSEYIALS